MTEILFAWEGLKVGDTDDSGFGGTVDLTPVEASIAITVVPSPGAGSLVALLPMVLRRRRRRTVAAMVATGLATGTCAAQQQPGGQVRIVEESPLLVAFDGPSFADSGEPDLPPDPGIAASSTHIVITINKTIATYSRSDLPDPTPTPVECMAFIDFFGDSTFDPRVVYDHNSGRFVASAQAGGVVAAGTHGSGPKVLRAWEDEVV